jgi:D-alanyl-D-alanine carboxypeptidase (penicillin-binding protein 5/6)
VSVRLRTIALAALLVVALVTPAAAQTDAPPRLQAQSAVLIEASTGDVIFERRADERRSIASTTKLMTALLTLEGASLDDVLTAVDYEPTPAESLAGLEGGERLTVRDLVRALLLPSANDAAETLAAGIAGSEEAFVAEMNARAKELGLTDTSYANPIGLDEKGNASSARDLVKLALVLRKNEFFRRTVDLPRATLTSGDHRRVVINRNRLVRDVDFVTGMKTGRTTQAGYVLVGSATRNGVTVLSAVLGEPSEAARDADTLALLRYGLGRYRSATLTRKGQALAKVKLAYRGDDTVRVVAGKTDRRTLPRGERTQMRLVGVPEELDGPLPAGARAGTAEFRVGGRVVASVPLVTARPVEAAGLGTRLASRLSAPSTMLLLGLLGGCTVLLVALRRRVVRRVGVGP